MEDSNFNEILQELQKDTLNSELISDNMLHFNYDGFIYRVKMPNQKENAIANSYKNNIYVKLLKQDNTLTIKQLKKLLKEKKDIDIELLDKQAKKLEDEVIQVYLTLAKKKDSEKKSIEKLKKQIDVLRQKRLAIILEKAEYLTPAIENQAQDDYYRFMSSFCTEKLIDKDKDTWEQVWKDFSEYEEDNSKLPYIALGKLTELMYGV